MLGQGSHPSKGSELIEDLDITVRYAVDLERKLRQHKVQLMADRLTSLEYSGPCGRAVLAGAEYWGLRVLRIQLPFSFNPRSVCTSPSFSGSVSMYAKWLSRPVVVMAYTPSPTGVAAGLCLVPAVLVS